jgi:transposase
MPRTHPPYAPEYRRRIIELARAGRSINELAREFEPSANAIRQWIKQAALDEGLRSDGLTTSAREALNRLRREHRVLREEREILAKAAAWFAQETGTTPSRQGSQYNSAGFRQTLQSSRRATLDGFGRRLFR